MKSLSITKLILLTSTIVLIASSIAYSGQISKLSQKASRLRIGMTRTQAIKLLGNPEWAIIPGDGGDLAITDSDFGLELRWRNPGCTAVSVMFNKKMKTTGWDGGRVCFKGADAFIPSKEYSCKKSDRAKYCK